MGTAHQGTKLLGRVSLCLLPLLFAVLQESSGEENLKRLFSQASCDFSIEFLKIQSKLTEGNVVVSPTSVAILLAILQQGAQENTLKQLETVLHMNAEQSKIGQSSALKSLQRQKTNVTLEWGNRAYIRPGFEIADAFNSTIRESFGATIQELNFVEPSPDEAALVVNNWIEEITHGNIKDLIAPSVFTQDTVLLLVNAIYFRGLWDVPFMKTLTKKDKFEPNPNNSVWASFMSQEERFLAGEDPETGVMWVDLPFKDEQFSMLFLLPTERHGLSQVCEKISGSLLRNIVDDDQTRIVTLTIPKFKLQEKVLLAKPLQEGDKLGDKLANRDTAKVVSLGSRGEVVEDIKDRGTLWEGEGVKTRMVTGGIGRTQRKLGLTDIFTKDANLDGITPNFKNLSVSKILHEASIEIDETGSTATAATSLSLEVLSFPKTSNRLIFKADHPFLFFILDRHNKVPLFAGIVADPS